jgi:hypothetical protein
MTPFQSRTSECMHVTDGSPQVRDFYNATVYPKWHEAEVLGFRSAPS